MINSSQFNRGVFQDKGWPGSLDLEAGRPLATQWELFPWICEGKASLEWAGRWVGGWTACRVVKREGGSTLGGLAVDPTLLAGERACPPHTPTN